MNLAQYFFKVLFSQSSNFLKKENFFKINHIFWFDDALSWKEAFFKIGTRDSDTIEMFIDIGCNCAHNNII